MKEPTPRNSRLALAGGMLAILAVGSAGFFVGRGSVAPVAETVPRIATEPPTERRATATPAEPDLLDRADLLALVAAAADATAAGHSAPNDARRAAGRRFSIALPFGCGGPLGDKDVTGTGWRYDAETGALRLQVASTRWTPADWIDAGQAAETEAIEGFWVPRPWTTAETCRPGVAPPEASGTEPVTLAGQTLAIGQVFRTDGARQDRRNGGPYIAVVRSPPEAFQAGAGFRVRLTGQLTDLPGGGAVRCRQPGGSDQRPICLVGVTFDGIVIENAQTGATLARWAGGSGRSE